MNRAIAFALLAVAALPATLQADEEEAYTRIRMLLEEDKFDQAEELYEGALRDYPNSRKLNSLAYAFYAYASGDEKYDKALIYIEYFVDKQAAALAEDPALARNFPYYLERLLAAYREANKANQAERKLNVVVEAVEQAAKDGNEELKLLVREVRNQQIALLAENGREKDARNLLQGRLTAAQHAIQEKSDGNAEARLDYYYLLKAEVDLLDATGSEKADAARNNFLAKLLGAAGKHKDQPLLTAAAIDACTDAAVSLARKDPAEAEKLLVRLKDFTKGLKTKDETVAGRLAYLEQRIPSLERGIAAGKAHAELIGQQAFPLEAEAWVNGMPLTDDDLKGKVVLLDFWAVWCGPCIATFPHLREWQERFADKGLVIIGVTRYYDFDWDADKQKPQHVAELSNEAEQAALEKFAKHYELKHRFMVAPSGSELQKRYGVTGIPQAVVIDREGKIRMIRVGSGDANAHDIEQLLVKLIGE